MVQNLPSRSPRRRVLKEALSASEKSQQWFEIVSAILQRISIPQEELDDAITTYHRLGDDLSQLLSVDRGLLDIHGQGSVVHKTAMRSHGNANFDVDAVCNRISFTKVELRNWFNEVGNALKQVPWVREVVKKNRCWRVFFHDKKYYIDLTPSRPDDLRKGTFIDVYSSEEPYPTDVNPSPSNPRGYSKWFKDIADKAPLLESVAASALMAKVEPIDTTPVHDNDVLRRAVQLMKFHRDMFYRRHSNFDPSFKPISVILTTLAARSFERHYNRGLAPLDLLVEIVDDMWDVPQRTVNEEQVYWVENPTRPEENFADKWPKDNGARADHYFRWLEAFEEDLAMLGNPAALESDIQTAFGTSGVDGWKAAHSKGATVLKLLADSAPKKPAPVPTHNSTMA